MSLTVWQGAVSTDYAVSGNWTNGVPTTSSDVRLTFGAANPIDASLNQSGVTISTFTQDQGYTLTVGDDTTYLQLHCPLTYLGTPSPSGSGNGSGRININFGANVSVCTVLASANAALDPNVSPVRLLGTSLTLNAYGGIVGLGETLGETSTLTALVVDGATVTLGAGVTMTLLNLFSGTVTNNTTITVPAANVYGNYTSNGTATHTALTVLNKGIAVMNAPCTITALIYDGTLDLSQGAGVVTITNATRYPGGKILDPNGRAVFTNFVQDAQGAQQSDARSTFGPNKTWKVI